MHGCLYRTITVHSTGISLSLLGSTNVMIIVSANNLYKVKGDSLNSVAMPPAVLASGARMKFPSALLLSCLLSISSASADGGTDSPPLQAEQPSANTTGQCNAGYWVQGPLVGPPGREMVYQGMMVILGVMVYQVVMVFFVELSWTCPKSPCCLMP